MIMFHFSFYIGSIFNNYFKRYFCKNYEISKNKSLEIELVRGNSLFGLNLMWTLRGHHAGVHFNLSLLTYNFSISFYDVRHWNYEKNIWLEN